jgi:hypothetical protein
MKHVTRIRIAALSAAFFLGGLTAAGFGMKSSQDSGSKLVTGHRRTQVIHETRTRTVHVRDKRSQPSAGPPAAAAARVQPVSQPQAPVKQPVKVQSRVSPTGGDHEGDDGGERAGDDD